MAKQKQQAKPAIAYRVRFVHDEDASFEECNGEARPLTEEEYAANQYMGCPQHWCAGTQVITMGPTHAPDVTVQGCAICGNTTYAPIPYEEYLAYYGNPDRHLYLGCVVEEQCGSCSGWAVVESLWAIDYMDDSQELRAITLGEWMPEEEARALPGYLGETARDLLEEAEKAPATTKDQELIGRIVGVLDGRVWTPETLETIAGELRASGYAIREPGERRRKRS